MSLLDTIRTKNELARQIKVMTACREGKQMIQVQQLRDMRGLICQPEQWVNTSYPIWDWYHYDYRVKPEPIELWINTHPQHGIVPGFYFTREEAIKWQPCNHRTVKLREVLES